MILTLWKVLKVLAHRRSPLARGIAFGVAMSVVALLIHSAVDFNLQIPANALTMMVILAMGWIAHTLTSSSPKVQFPEIKALIPSIVDILPALKDGDSYE